MQKLAILSPINCGLILHKLSIMDKSTETLNFFIGGFFGGYERIIWLNDKLYHLMDGEPEDEEVKPDEVLNVTITSKKDWEEFWLTVDALKVVELGKKLY